MGNVIIFFVFISVLIFYFSSGQLDNFLQLFSKKLSYTGLHVKKNHFVDENPPMEKRQEIHILEERAQKHQEALKETGLNGKPPIGHRSLGHKRHPLGNFTCMNGIVQEIILQGKILKTVMSRGKAMVSNRP